MALTGKKLSVRESRRTRIKRARKQRQKGWLLSAAFMLGAGLLVDMPVASADVTINLSGSDSQFVLKSAAPNTTYTVASSDKVTKEGASVWDGNSTVTIGGGSYTFVVETTDGKKYQITGPYGNRYNAITSNTRPHLHRYV